MQVLADIQFNIKIQEITFCKYDLYIQNRNISLTFPQLLNLRRKVVELTTPHKLSNLIDSDNFVLLFIADKEHLLFLEVSELLNLKDELSYCFSNF